MLIEKWKLFVPVRRWFLFSKVSIVEYEIFVLRTILFLTFLQTWQRYNLLFVLCKSSKFLNRFFHFWHISHVPNLQFRKVKTAKYKKFKREPSLLSEIRSSYSFTFLNRLWWNLHVETILHSAGPFIKYVTQKGG